VTRYFADLHCHSTASDGSDRPRRVLERAHQAGLQVLALTDHDTVAGIPEARETAEELKIKLIAGVELTCYAEKKEIHILGYGINIDSPELLVHCENFQKARLERAHSTSRKLAECGAPIDMDKVMASADGGVIGRPHVARALIEAGHVETFQEAFDLYLGEGKPACVSKLNVNPKACIDIILQAGGIAIMAHPGLNDVEPFIPEMIAVGCSGIEVWHSAHDIDTSSRLHCHALDYGLLYTAGSDCHGVIRGDGTQLLGTVGLNHAQWQKIERALS
jgi:3',5'-nucleoside bisphosphate phosphatase